MASGPKGSALVLTTVPAPGLTCLMAESSTVDCSAGGGCAGTGGSPEGTVPLVEG